MNYPRIYSGFHYTQVVISAGMIGVIGLLIIGLWCTDVAFEKYIIPVTSATKTSNITQVIPLVKNLMIVTPGLSGTSSCTITECKTISCTSTTLSDPGAFASSFISSIFKIQCPTMRTIGNLIFRDCKFPGGKLKNSWLMSNIDIDNIRFENCELSEIDVGAFATNFLKNIKSLAIINAQIATMKRYIFEELVNLRSLIIHDNVIIEAEYDLLNSVADNLQIIELDRSIINPQVLLNITTGRPLSQVQLVSLQGNNIRNLSRVMFSGFPNIISLYMDASKIINIDVNTFKSTRLLQQIFMNNNLMTTLPVGVFNPLLLHNPNFKLSITDNPWHCDCQLKWMYEMIIEFPKMFITIPKCQTPEINSDKAFLTANFCHGASDDEIIAHNNTSTMMIDSTTEMQNSTEHNDGRFINILCQNSKFLQLKNLSRISLYISDNDLSVKLSRNFVLHEYNNGTVGVNINNREMVVTILWFNIDVNQIGNVNCLKSVRGWILLNNLDKDTTYIICILNELQLMPSPFNCLGLKTERGKNARTWLSNGDKAIVLSIYSLTLILCGLFGSGICLFVIRRNPSMLRGSSRVIMVRRGDVKALILPKGICYSNINRQRINKEPVTSDDKTNANYLTPIEIRKSNSSNIYESIRNKIISSNNFTINKPPPLPPHPYHGVHKQQQQHHHHQPLTSLSLRIDTQHDKMVDDELYQTKDTGIYFCNDQK